MLQYLAGVGAGSHRTIHQSLHLLAALHLNVQPGDPKTLTMKWEKLRRPDVQALANSLAGAFAPATANKLLSLLRGVIRACRNLGLMPAAECDAAVSVTNVPATWQPPTISLLTAGDVRRLFEACAAKPGIAGRRDAALLAVFLSSGLRRAEAAMLDHDDVRAGSKSLRIRPSEPDRQQREAPLSPAARKYLGDWMRALHDADDAAATSTPLLLPVNKSGRVQPRRLTDQAIYNMIRRIGIDAGLPTVTSRALRLTYVINLIAKGLPVERVQALVGHASWVTTGAYRDLARRAAVDGFKPFDLPYVKPRSIAPTVKGGRRE